MVGGVAEHFNFPWHLMMESASYEKLPVDIKWVNTLGGTGEITSALDSGRLDLAVGLTEGMISAIADGNKSVILRTYVSTPLQWGVHVPAWSNLHQMADLVGQRFAISRLGSGSHLMAHVLADEQGFAVGDEQFVKVGDLDGARAALAAGDAEIFLWDRSTTSPYVDNGEFRRVGLQPTPWPAFVVAGRSDFVAARSTEIDQVLDRVARSATSLVSDSRRVELVSQRYGIEESEVTQWFEETRWDCARPMDPEIVSAAQSRLVALGLVTSELPPDHYLA